MVRKTSVDQETPHAPDCPYNSTGKGDYSSCNCFLSWNSTGLARTAVFEPATLKGPSDINGYLDDQATMAIEEFVINKRKQWSGNNTTNNKDSKDLYTSLEEGEIRVLELFAGERDTPLQGTLHVVSIDFTHPLRQEKDTGREWKHPGSSFIRHTNHAVSVANGHVRWYTALSYVWGKPVFDQRILFRGASLAITSSLMRALVHLRSPKHSIFLWCDQICINQASSKEKVQQIPLMDRIYTNATNTIIWLGDDDGLDPVLAFKTLDTVYSRLQMTDAEITPADFSRLDLPDPGDRSWWAVRQLFQASPWFSRTWTIQEAVLSRNLFIQRGNAVACWDDFAAWCYTLHSSHLLRWLMVNDDLDVKYGESPIEISKLSAATIVNSIQADRIQGLTLVQKEFLLNMLVSTRYAAATEPKDKVYGVLGIADSKIVPNYSPSVSARDVFRDACITQLPRNAYEILSCVDSEHPLKPSWVPDWSTPRVTEALGYSTKAWTLYYAGGKQSAGGEPYAVRLSDQNTQMTLRGKIVDEIAAVGVVVEDPILDIDNPQSNNAYLTSIVTLINNSTTSQSYPDSKTAVYDAFLHTLLAGRDSSTVQPPSAEHSEVFSLILDSTTGSMPSLPDQTYSVRRKKGFFTLDSLRSRRPAKVLEDLRAGLRTSLTMRACAITAGGYFALVSRGTRAGDEVVVFDRACIPFVVRRTAVEGKWEVLGETYVHGIMHGEAMERPHLEMQDITLV